MFRSLLSIFSSAKRQIHGFSTNKIIKPASPTHSSLNHHNLSPMDQVTPSQYLPIVFYYPNKVSNVTSQDITNRVKLSLFETLAQYYPFAGRLNSAAYVDCNDEGVEFQEVNIKRQMSEILDQDKESLSLVFPDGLVWGNVNRSSPLLVIRLSKFECGGLSIAVCLSHKLGDAKSLNTFMTSWATKTRQTNYSSTNLCEDVQEYSPHFISCPWSDANNIMPEYQIPKKHWETMRFVFPNSKITKLKEMVANKTGLENISRVEVVSALVYKCATTAISANSGLFNPSVLAFPVNMRQVMFPPLPETTIGNYYWPIYIPIRNESEKDINTLVGKIKKAKMEVKVMKSFNVVSNLSTLVEFTQNNYKLLWCSSLCRMQFYQVDFGWGNPSRVAIADTPTNNSYILMDTPTGDGIEILISLEEENMATFQLDKEIMAYIH